MDAAAVEVLRLFTDKMPAGWAVADADLDRGAVVVTQGDEQRLLRFDGDDLLLRLRGVEDERHMLWGTDVSPAETLARLISIHLEEALATEAAAPRTAWRYAAGAFVPVP